MSEISRDTTDYLLLAHIQHTNAGTGCAHRRKRIDPATWIVSGALFALSFLLVAFAGN